jgi:hypothetical protein
MRILRGNRRMRADRGDRRVENEHTNWWMRGSRAVGGEV